MRCPTRWIIALLLAGIFVAGLLAGRSPNGWRQVIDRAPTPTLLQHDSWGVVPQELHRGMYAPHTSSEV